MISSSVHNYERWRFRSVLSLGYVPWEIRNTLLPTLNLFLVHRVALRFGAGRRGALLAAGFAWGPAERCPVTEPVQASSRCELKDSCARGTVRAS